MSKPVFRRLPNGELKLDYTEAARRIKLSRADVRKADADTEIKCQSPEEVGSSHFE